MNQYQVHRVRFFDYSPQAVQCLAYQENTNRLALSRADGSIEIWSLNDDWYQEKVIPAESGHSVEALVWCGSRLFSGGLQGTLVEYDLVTLMPKAEVPSNSGAIWCLDLNEATSHIAAGTEEGSVVLFELTTDGVEYSRMLDKQEGRILSIAWYAPDDLIVTGGMDNIRIWSLSSGHAIQRITLGRVEKNKETIVWTLAVTSNFTIISGDSRGKTSFWNGNQGTLIKAFQSHKADVLSLCVNKEGTSVLVSGIDPALVQFEYVPVQSNSDWKMWVKSAARTQHSHDVRAVILAGDIVVSGGIDCYLVINQLDQKGALGTKRRIPPIPHKRLVHTAREAKMLLFQYSDYLELWRLGTTRKKSDQNNEILPLSSSPVKLVQLKSRDGEVIVTSAVSSKADVIAYSDRHVIRIFQVTLVNSDVGPSGVKMSRIKSLPAETLPAQYLSFTPDGTKLVSATQEGSIQVLQIKNGNVSLLHNFDRPKDEEERIHLLSISSDGKHVAAAHHSGCVHVYSLHKLKHVCSLPRHRQPTALCFSPVSQELLAVYSDQTIHEYDISSKEYTSWSRSFNKRYHPQWLKLHNKFTSVWYHPSQPHLVFLQDPTMICVLDKRQPVPPSSVKLIHRSGWQQDGNTDTSSQVFHICSRYRFLLHADFLQEDQLVVVEKTPVALMEALPPTLKQKKFGT